VYAAGHVVTNFHVIKGASEVKVTLLDQSCYTARVVGADAAKDVAVLQLDMPPEKAAQLQPVSLGMSSGLIVGQKVYAIGG
jgi:S1-C subfamily serine protease